MAPMAVPRKNGVSREARAKTAPLTRCQRSVCTCERNANPAPRRTMPSAATLSGTNSVVKIRAKATGKPVQSSTRAMISQTWLDSHTGPMERSIRRRAGAPAAAEPASRSQTPPPKSAPASTA